MSTRNDEIKAEADVEVWEKRWQDGRIGFDQHAAHKSLVDLVLGPRADELGIARRGKAVVPGCGRGYDVDLLARRGLDAIGVDISPKGVEEAKVWLSKQDKGSEDGTREVVAADLFEWAKGVSGQFDVLLDYTFLCALPPSLRETYISTLATLARSSASTRLITLMFPLLPLPHDLTQGPPFALSVEEYHRLLDDRWELQWSQDVPEEAMRSGPAKGGEMVGVWALRA